MAEYWEGYTNASVSTASSGELSLSGLMAEFKKLKYNESKVSCFLMMEETANKLFEDLSFGGKTCVECDSVLPSNKGALMGLPLYVARSQEEYLDILDNLNKKNDKPVGVISGDVPSYIIWSHFYKTEYGLG